MVRWVNVLLGAWMLGAGLLAGPGTPEFGDHIFLGLALFLVAFFAMALPQARILNVVLGVWAILSPFVFRYMRAPFGLNDIVVGILVVWAAVTPTRPRRRRDREAVASV